MKKKLQKAVENIHLKFFQRDTLPNKLGIYFHELDKSQHVQFKALVSHFLTLGYKFVFYDEFLKSHDKVICLSFDDNYYSWYESLELLDALGIKVTFFVNTLPLRDKANKAIINDYFERICFQGDRKTLSSNEINEIASCGHRIGCHTHSHFNLSKVKYATAVDDIKINKDILESILGTTINSFAFPYGMPRFFPERLNLYCQSIGLKSIAHACPGLLYAQQHESRLQRTGWHFQNTLERNINYLKIDGRLFHHLTGRSAIS